MQPKNSNNDFCHYVTIRTEFSKSTHMMLASQFSICNHLSESKDSHVKVVSPNEPSVLTCIKFNMSITSKRVKLQ